MPRNKLSSEKGISLSGGCCVVCGWKKKSHKGKLLVEGAHVRGFRNISDYDNFDNIIGLCPNHHTEFDAGNITIDPIKKTSVHFDKKDPFNNKKIKGKIKHVQKGYFDYHNKKIFNSK
jgi:predicted restriction endonuclease